ncbi:MAG: glycosyltransferase [Parasphingorhabdus sp.]|uniref:glycosyltransferase n=1 Tax=Parasphingorhabdus sp. TaxID=2709688 RepID=UPI003299587C
MADPMNRVTVLIPMLNEENALPATIKGIKLLDPQPDEILVVDGGSEDQSVDLVKAAGFSVLSAPKTGRGAQINFGVDQAKGDIICVLHADSILPPDAVTVICAAMADGKTGLASFTPRIAGPQGTRWGSTLHNWIKTWYAPMLTRPHLFLRGVRLLFGDHAMFFRRENFQAIGGCDERVVVMEEADLCIKLSRFGKIRMIPRWVWTSDRRITAWGRWRANWIYLKVGLMWAMGARERLADEYPDIR